MALNLTAGELPCRIYTLVFHVFPVSILQFNCCLWLDFQRDVSGRGLINVYLQLRTLSFLKIWDFLKLQSILDWDTGKPEHPVSHYMEVPPKSYFLFLIRLSLYILSSVSLHSTFPTMEFFSCGHR